MEEFGSAWMSSDASQGPRERDLQPALTAAMWLKVKELPAQVYNFRSVLGRKTPLCCPRNGPELLRGRRVPDRDGRAEAMALTTQVCFRAEGCRTVTDGRRLWLLLHRSASGQGGAGP